METAAPGRRGTVTELSTEYPPEDVEKAATRLQDSIAAAENEAERLRGFISDNGDLISLVQSLPDALHHHAMVPFGPAAFFPGRLIHTNEFLILLGEGYYADATAKHALAVLRRRDNSLRSQLASVNAVVQDLRAEASFFRSTASEIAESGIVEIREDYVEESSGESDAEPGALSSTSEADEKMVALGDEEFARIMARFEELEKEEAEAEAENQSDDDDDEDKKTDSDVDDRFDKVSLAEIEDPQKPDLVKAKDKEQVAEEIRNKQHYHHRRDFTDEELNCTGLTAQAITKDGSASNRNTVSTNMKKHIEKSAVENKFQAFTSSQIQAPAPSPEASFDSRKAFTGSIVEHADNLETSLRRHVSSQTSGSQPSKPVSRFKMQRK